MLRRRQRGWWAFLIVLLAACSAAPPRGGASDPRDLPPPLTVVRQSPAQDARTVPLDSPISVTFSAPVLSAADLQRGLSAPPDPAPLLTVTPPISATGRWLARDVYALTPAAFEAGGLRPATVYTVTLSAHPANTPQLRLAAPVSWRFKTAAPLLTDYSPRGGGYGLAPDLTVTAWFDPVVDVMSAQRRFQLLDRLDRPVPGDLTLLPCPRRRDNPPCGLRFTPHAPLRGGETYRAGVDAGVLSVSGAPINAAPFRWQFTIAADFKVASVKPLDGERGVALDGKIALVFNDPPATGAAPALTFTPPVPGRGQWTDDHTYVFSPTAALAPSTDYRAELAAGLLNARGAPLASPFRWHFVTEWPRVVASAPANAEQQTDPRQPLTLRFNQDMDPASTAAAITLRTPGGTVLSAQVSVSGATATVTPTQRLERGTSYQLDVAAGPLGAQSRAAMRDSYRATFSVMPLPRFIKLSSDGSQFQLNSDVLLQFSTLMDPASVLDNLTIAPKPTTVLTASLGTALALSMPLEASTEYTVTIGAAARDLLGVPLGVPATAAFRTGPAPRQLRIVGPDRWGDIASYNASQPVRVPLRTSQLQSVDYTLTRFAPSELITVLDQNHSRDLSKLGTLVLSGTLNLPTEPRRPRLDLLQLGRLAPGLYRLSTSGYPRTSGYGEFTTDVQLLAVSNYALTLKQSADQLVVWAVDLRSGKPAASLALQATPCPTSCPTGQTAADGTLTLPLSNPLGRAPLVYASDPQQFALVDSGWDDGITGADFGLPTDPSQSTVRGAVSTDRPLFRPGQTVQIWGALRVAERTGYQLPVSAGLGLAIVDPTGKRVRGEDLTLDRFGTFHTALPLDATAAIGSYQINVTRGTQPVAHGTFRVAAYRKPAFTVSVAAAAPTLVAGEPLTATVNASYFAGGPLSGAAVRWRLLARPLRARPAAEYSFGSAASPYDWYRWQAGGPLETAAGQLVSEGTATTDAAGDLTLRLPSQVPPREPEAAPQPYELTLDAEVTDRDGQVIAGRVTSAVYPTALQLGVRLDGYVVAAGGAQPVRVLALDLSGAPRASQPITVSVARMEWYSAERRGDDGRYYWETQRRQTPILTEVVTTDAAGRAALRFSPPRGGSYQITVSGTDAAGRQTSSNAYSWVSGYGARWGQDNTSRVELVADKPRYRPGETAQILVPAPQPGMLALLTLERTGVLEHRVVQLRGTSDTIALPITAAHAPNIFVSVVLVGAGGAAGDELRVGLLQLPIETEQQALTVTLTPDQPQAAPRTAVRFTVHTADAQGRGVPASVALALVDKAVLSLAEDRNPSLMAAFYTALPLGVQTANTLVVAQDRVTRQLLPGSKGGDGGSGGDALRRDFPDTAYWNPALLTDANGDASVTITLPDTLTTWRLTARAITAATQVGEQQVDIISVLPLMLRPALPRFLSVGDALTVRAALRNTTAQPLTTTVTLDAAALRLNGPASQTVTVPAGGHGDGLAGPPP